VDVRPDAAPQLPSTCQPTTHSDPGRGPALVSSDTLADTPDKGELVIPADALVTPLAREEAQRRGIRLTHATGCTRSTPESGALRVAVGADHGGFAMKAAVLEWVREWGHVAVDLGTHDENPVDYPDLAQLVAEAVAGGQVDLGICIDGAGIGSAMAANKVPGARAANCWNEATAHNAREHNLANVLSLGGRMLDEGSARAVVRTFLSTPEGAERHRRRVAKIDSLEQHYSRRGTRA